MESYHTKDLTLEVFEQILSEDEFRAMENVGIAIQCYLRDVDEDLNGLAAWVRRRGTPIGVRLVKGAYWDFETAHAKATGWPVPVFEEKWQTDASFERQCRLLLRHAELIRPAVGSHNVRSIAYAIATAKHLGVPREDLEIQMLYGMGDAEKHVLCDLDYRVRVYMPYGELVPGMAYLVRRLLENTSNDSFLRATFSEEQPWEELLARPAKRLANERAGGPASAPTPAADLPYWKSFHNEPPLDFSRAPNRQNFQHALRSVEGRLGGDHPLVIDGKRIETKQRMVSLDPSRSSRVVGRASSATAADVERAVGAASQVLCGWTERPVADRGDMLRRAADLMRRRRYELAAWMVYECGKSWRESDADVCEAVDFCRFYAAGAEVLLRPDGVRVPGEENRFAYLPRGVTAVIAPWNFPLAILTGMTAAALVTGNTVVMKPAEQSPVMAALLMEILQEAGIPPGVVNYLPGRGEEAGAALVTHPDVLLIAFTGSMAVGLDIQAQAAEASRKSRVGVKRVIAEMGGKNAIAVDDDADLDEAVLGIVRSAFGYQGQKCSACSRVIAVRAVYEPLLDRLVEAARSLVIGPAWEPSVSVGPLIDQPACERVRSYIELGRSEAREVLAVDVGRLSEEGFFVGPHIFADVPPEARIAQEEIFGPLLAVMPARDFADAIRLANATPFGLTGAVYSRSPAHLRRASSELMVGNLYLNRQSTGALVGRQPFGGLKMSGIGSKAGGPDYLLQFVQPKTVTENTIRRGFAPEDLEAP
jgi:RHH-type proline utilization regulon transcriptional repressor/proline dehydrogenase/delta 1-pyrroline-5-carboxylate dehydrogenase